MRSDFSLNHLTQSREEQNRLGKVIRAGQDGIEVVMNLSGKTIRLKGCSILASRDKMCFSDCILRCPAGTLRRSNRQKERHIVRRVVDPYCTRTMATKNHTC